MVAPAGSAILQGLLIREFAVACCGHELSTGLTLGKWPFWETRGSGWLGRRIL